MNNLIKELENKRKRIDSLVHYDETKAARRQGTHYISVYKQIMVSISDIVEATLKNTLKHKDMKTLLDYIAVSRRAITHENFFNSLNIQKLHDEMLETIDDVIYITYCFMMKGENYGKTD